MSLQQARARFNDIARTANGIITQAARLELNALFPNDFEFYLMGFEVVNGSDIPTDRFVLPVLPDRISINNQKIVNIKKTAAGITSYHNNTFEPITIQISGSFGRRMRLLTGLIKSGEDVARNPAQFQLNVKTGYGSMKELERIYQKSSEVDGNGQPNRIHFYNLAFNQNFIVEIQNLQFSQDKASNMIWNYTLNMTAIAPAETGNFLFSSRAFGEIGIVNKAIDELAGSARSLLGI